MPTVTEIEKLAFALPDAERALLVSRLIASLPAFVEDERSAKEIEAEDALINSLPGVLHEDDEGYAEALRRDAEMDADPSTILSLEEFEELVRRRFPSCG